MSEEIEDGKDDTEVKEKAVEERLEEMKGMLKDIKESAPARKTDEEEEDVFVQPSRGKKREEEEEEEEIDLKKVEEMTPSELAKMLDGRIASARERGRQDTMDAAKRLANAVAVDIARLEIKIAIAEKPGRKEMWKKEAFKEEFKKVARENPRKGAEELFEMIEEREELKERRKKEGEEKRKEEGKKASTEKPVPSGRAGGAKEKVSMKDALDEAYDKVFGNT